MHQYQCAYTHTHTHTIFHAIDVVLVSVSPCWETSGICQQAWAKEDSHEMADYRQECLKRYAMCLENWFSYAGLMNGSHLKEYGECGSCTILASDCCYAGNSYCEH